jgi:hypothetical protein
MAVAIIAITDRRSKQKGPERTPGPFMHDYLLV